MSAIDNPPAFPTDGRIQHGTDYDGMSIRDWFAGQALVGLLASGKWSNSGVGFAEYISVEAGNIADAMLAARSIFNDADNQRED